MKVAILGAGGLAKVACEAIKLESTYQIAGFFEDKKKGDFIGHRILGECGDYENLCRKFKIENVFIAFGYHFLKARLFYYSKINKNKNLRLISAVHPSAIISSSAQIGRGVYVGPGVIINPGARIGDNSVIWSGSIIEHDNIIGKNVFITPGVTTAGYVKIGDNSFIGMSATIAKANIGKNVTVGAGSLVLNDSPSNSYLFGSPAKVIKIKDKISYV
jgi:sugar O-acyltransferase (sialic acid O-acetyltransferase NeuD family)